MLFMVACLGCANIQVRARYPMGAMAAHSTVVSDADCRRMLTMRRTWGALAAGASAAGGVGGLAAFPVTGDARYAVGAAALALGISGAVFSFLAGSASEDLTAYCVSSP